MPVGGTSAFIPAILLFHRAARNAIHRKPGNPAAITGNYSSTGPSRPRRQYPSERNVGAGAGSNESRRVALRESRKSLDRAGHTVQNKGSRLRVGWTDGSSEGNSGRRGAATTTSTTDSKGGRSKILTFPPVSPCRPKNCKTTGNVCDTRVNNTLSPVPLRTFVFGFLFVVFATHSRAGEHTSRLLALEDSARLAVVPRILSSLVSLPFFPPFSPGVLVIVRRKRGAA